MGGGTDPAVVLQAGELRLGESCIVREILAVRRIALSQNANGNIVLEVLKRPLLLRFVRPCCKLRV